MRVSRPNWQRSAPDRALTAANSPAETGTAAFGLSRRGFIKGGLGAAGLAAAAPLLTACGGRSSPEAPTADTTAAPAAPAAVDERIVIIGAGAAGMAAAQDLQARGFRNVVILEARERVGGRIWTERLGGSVPVELGATWIHGIRGNPVYDIVERRNIATAPTDYDNEVRYDQSGRELAPVDEQLYRAYMRMSYDRPDLSLQEVFEDFVDVNGFGAADRVSWRQILNSRFEHEFGADISDLAISSYEGGSDLRGGDVVIPGGYSQIADALAEGLDIRLDHAVERIDYSGDEVEVTIGSGEAFAADRVIVTVPLGILQSGRISFEPPLPDSKRESIDALRMGVLNRTSLLFDEVFWKPDVEWIGIAGEPPGQWAETLNVYPYQQQPVLAMFNAGSFGVETEQYTDDELTAQALAALEGVFGRVPEPVDSVSTRWNSDPWTKGSYSYVPGGVSFDNYRKMARPVGERLFFAGEATQSQYPSTVQGAMLSGQRAAVQIENLPR